MLVKECNDLMTMLAQFGQQELYSFEKPSSTTEELIVNKLRDSVKLIFEENSKLNSDQDILKNEIAILTTNLNESQKKVHELTKIIKDYESNLVISNNSNESEQWCDVKETTLCHDKNDFVIERVVHDKSEQFYSIDSMSTAIKSMSGQNTPTSNCRSIFLNNLF